MRVKFIYVLSILCLLSNVSGFTQEYPDSLLYVSEENINQLFIQMSKTYEDKDKQQINEQINDSLYSLISKKEAFDHNFDSLKSIGKLILDDVRIFTWNLPKSNGSHEYFGYILHEVEKDSVVLYVLTDKSLSIKNPEYVKCSDKNWFGALYYDIKKVKVDKKHYYVIMGFDPNSLFTNKKIIDVLYFDELGLPVFGYPFFESKKGMKYRVVFEYAKRASMSLRYNKNVKMIVFDHLAPFEERYEGVVQFYGPDFSYDAYDFQKGTWKYIEDIDVRN